MCTGRKFLRFLTGWWRNGATRESREDGRECEFRGFVGGICGRRKRNVGDLI